MSQETSNSTKTWTFWGSVGAVLTAAVCCIGPALLLSVGVTGAWVAWLGDLEPYLLGASVVGFVGYLLARSSEDQSPRSEGRDDTCDDDCFSN